MVEAGIFEGKSTFALIFVVFYLYLIFNMDSPYMLFFAAPIFFQAIAGAFQPPARKLTKNKKRSLIDSNTLQSLSSLFKGLTGQTEEKSPKDFKKLFNFISPEQIQGLVQDVSKFMSHKKINKRGN